MARAPALAPPADSPALFRRREEEENNRYLASLVPTSLPPPQLQTRVK